MSKHKKHKSDVPVVSRSERRWRRRTLLAAGAVGVLGGGYLLLGGGAGGTGRSFSVKGGETRNVLDPLGFSAPNVRRAYAAAAKHPEVLDQVYCYCNCEKPPFFHKSLKSCFTDFHGAG